jgi:tripartite-type tricarboxylate transporter receptor subunit TctC
MRPTLIVSSLALGLAYGAVAVSAQASDAPEVEDFPTESLTILVPYGPGGLTDSRGRIFQQEMADVIGQSVIVENVSGGGALVGANAAYARPADGYTVLTAATVDGPHAHSVLSPTGLPWTWDDWTPLGIFTVSVLGFVVSNESGYESLEQVLEEVRANPGSVTLASIGPGRLDDLEMIDFMQKTDTLGDWNWAFYGSSADIQADLISGDVDVGFLGVSRTDMIDHPDFNVLAMGINRDEIPEENFPFDWPTVEEAIGTELDILSAGYGVMYVRADVPEDRKAYLEWAFEETTKQEGFIENRVNAGEPPMWISREETQERLDNLVAQMQDLKEIRDDFLGD